MKSLPIQFQDTFPANCFYFYRHEQSENVKMNKRSLIKSTAAAADSEWKQENKIKLKQLLVGRGEKGATDLKEAQSWAGLLGEWKRKIGCFFATKQENLEIFVFFSSKTTRRKILEIKRRHYFSEKFTSFLRFTEID
jgi:hypothetical protein